MAASSSAGGSPPTTSTQAATAKDNQQDSTSLEAKNAMEEGEVSSSDEATQDKPKEEANDKERKRKQSSSSSPRFSRSRSRLARDSSRRSPPPLNYDDDADDESRPPLPDVAPPLPDEQPPQQDDGWDAIWDDRHGAYYFHNRFTNITQWQNPRVPDGPSKSVAVPDRAPGTDGPAVSFIPSATAGEDIHPAVRAGYNPAIHGNYDPNADYAQAAKDPSEAVAAADAMSTAANPTYEAVGQFNRFTGRFQHESLGPENYNDEHKSHKQLSGFFDVDSAMNSHNGKSLKSERAKKKLTSKEVKAYRERHKQRKEEKRRNWLLD